MGRPLDLFFAISSLLIAIPTGVKVLNWSATMFGGRIRLQVPMLFWHCVSHPIPLRWNHRDQPRGRAASIGRQEQLLSHRAFSFRLRWAGSFSPRSLPFITGFRR